MSFMSHEVVVTRKGQITIPASVRKKLDIQEGTKLKVVTEGEKVVFTKLPSLFDLAGTSRLTIERAFQLLDDMRAEE